MPRLDLTVDTPSPDEGHETIRLALVETARLLGLARKAITDLRADVAALTDRVAAAELRLPPL